MAIAYVLGTFDDPLEFLTDFNEEHAILVELLNAPVTDTEQTILDRAEECEIDDTIPIFFPAETRATAYADLPEAALLRVACKQPLDCPELDRVPIRSFGCNPPPNCIAEPDALVAALARPTCRLPIFYPPSSPTTRRTRNLEFGYASATAVAYDMSWEDAGGLTNYVEFPYHQFLHWRADPDNPSDAYGLRYRGIVRVWESGTIQMVGEMRFVDGATLPTSLTELSYKVWFGETGQPGSLQTVATIPTDGDYHAVNWSGRPGSLEHCETYYGGIPAGGSEGPDYFPTVELWQYPDGMVLPPDPPDVWGGSAGGTGITACGVTRDGNDLDFAWSIAPEAFTTQHFIATVEIDTEVTNDATTSGFNEANGIAHLNASTLFGSLGGTASRTIPDSATTGLRVAIWTGSQNVNTGTFDCGPFLRLAYAPTIQQGVDPIP